MNSWEEILQTMIAQLEYGQRACLTARDLRVEAEAKQQTACQVEEDVDKIFHGLLLLLQEHCQRKADDDSIDPLTRDKIDGFYRFWNME